MKVRLRVESWLKEHSDLINKNQLDNLIDVPKGTIQKFVKYDKTLNDERIKRLDKVIKGFQQVNGVPYIKYNPKTDKV